MAYKTKLKVQLAVLLVVISALSMSAIAPARQAFSQQKMIEAEEKKLAALQEENRKLKERLDRLNDPDYVEKLARDELGLVKPGEVAYVVVPPEPVTSTVESKPAPPKPWYERVLDKIKSIF